MACWVLVHSPLLSPVFWGPLAAVFRGRGQFVVTADMGRALSMNGQYTQAQADLVVSAVDSDVVRLVAHSGAGPILPAIAEGCVAVGPRFPTASSSVPRYRSRATPGWQYYRGQQWLTW